MVKCGLKPMGDRALSFVAYSLDFGHAGDRLRYGSCVPSLSESCGAAIVAAYASQSHMFTKGNFRSRQPSLDRAAGAARPNRAEKDDKQSWVPDEGHCGPGAAHHGGYLGFLVWP
jgi:hypothetical protein